MQTITTLIRRSPFNAVAVGEGLRMSVGFLLSDNKVRLVLMEDGVHLLSTLQPELIGAQDLNRHLRTLQDFGSEIIAERQSLAERNVSPPDEVMVKSREEIALMLADCRYVTVI